jgi:hypothetical protein
VVKAFALDLHQNVILFLPSIKRRQLILTQSYIQSIMLRTESSSQDVVMTHFAIKGSISSTFYEKLLCAQIPKAQKDTEDLT